MIHVKIDNRSCNYLLSNDALKSVPQESNFGVEVSYKCDWKGQIEKAVRKANRTAAWVFCDTVSQSKSVLLPIHKSLVEPHLE